MRMFPQVNACFYVHFVGFVVCVLSGIYFIDPTLLPAGQFEAALRQWPEIWVAIPLVMLTLNVLYFFIEYSLMGFLAVLACSGLLVYHVATYALICAIIGGVP